MVSEMDEQRRTNRLSWDELAPAHAASPEYGFQRFADDPTHLSDVVRFDLPRLGDISGLRGVHLQCHIGTDTVSLARLGARMTGLDFAARALAEGRRLATLANADVDFVEAELYDAPTVLPNGTFDLVYTGVGALCWLPDIAGWARVVATLLRPGGRLFIREGHPVMWTLDEKRADGLLAVEYPYFEAAGAVAFDEPGTYVTTDVEFEHTVTWSWNHGLAEIVTAVMDAGMRLTMLEEHLSVPWRALEHGMEATADGEWRIVDRPLRIPLSYTLQAVREG
jgi:SAM-dependent methyltransferase